MIQNGANTMGIFYYIFYNMDYEIVKTKHKKKNIYANRGPEKNFIFLD